MKRRGMVSNQARILAERSVVIVKVDEGLGMTAIIFSDIADGIEAISVGQDEIAVRWPVGRETRVEVVVVVV